MIQNLPMTTFHRLSIFAGLLTAPLLVSCSQEAPQKTAPTMPSRPAEVKIGVFPEEATSDNTQRLLEIKEWKFKVNIPREHKHLLYILEVREKGQKPRTINRAILGVAEGPQRRELTLAMLPLSFDWTKSEQVKMQFNLSGSIGSGEIENPLKSCTFTSWGQAKPLPDGSFLLMEGNRSGPTSVLGNGQGQVVLVLKLQSASDAATLLAAG